MLSALTHLPLHISSHTSALTHICPHTGFYSLIHASVPSTELATLGFDYSYASILTTMLL